MIAQQSALCMRVQSSRRVSFKDGSVGWLHAIDGRPVEYRPQRQEIKVDWRAMFKRWWFQTEDRQRKALAAELGVYEATLDKFGLGAVWAREHNAWAFPMWDGLGHIIGARLRCLNGQKLSVKGSHNGLFIPFCNHEKTMMVVEGPTDQCAGMTLGFYTVGRPSCSGGLEHLKDLCRRLGINRVIIVADNDQDDYEHPERINPGIHGATMLSENLHVPNIIVSLPTKDIRDFLRLGGNRITLDSLIKNETWKK